MSDFVKGEGAKIAIKFTEHLIGDITENKAAFSINGKERKHVNGELIDGDYQIDKIERHPIFKVWELEDRLKLDDPGEVQITDSKCYEVSSGTSLIGTVNANAGDIILATISHRSTFIMPDGWTKLYESIAIGSNQKMIFAVKEVSETSEVSFTAIQTSSARIYLNLIAISGISYIENANYEAISIDEATSINAPDKIEGEKLIWGCSANLWATSNFGSWKTEPDDLQLISLPTTTQAKQANFVDFGEGTPMGRRFIPNADTGTSIIVSAVRLVQKYTTPKVYISEAIKLTGQYRIRYSSVKPVNTNIKIEITTGKTQGEWQEVSNGEVITANNNLWIKVTLTTTDETITPILKEIWLEEPEQRKDTILLTMKPLKRFNNVEGELTVSYDQTKGTLKGEGGSVESFEHSFLPTDLVPVPNPYSPERLIIKHRIEGNFIRIYYTRAYVNEKITAKPNLIVDFINVGEINP